MCRRRGRALCAGLASAAGLQRAHRALPTAHSPPSIGPVALARSQLEQSTRACARVLVGTQQPMAAISGTPQWKALVEHVGTIQAT